MSMEELDRAIAYHTKRQVALEKMWKSIGLRKDDVYSCHYDLVGLIRFHQDQVSRITWKKKTIIAEEQMRAAGWTDPISEFMDVITIAEILPKLSDDQKADLFQSLKDRTEFGWCN